MSIIYLEKQYIIDDRTNSTIDMIFNLVEKEMTGVKIISLSKNVKNFPNFLLINGKGIKTWS